MRYKDYLRKKFKNTDKIAEAEGYPCFLNKNKGNRLKELRIYGNTINGVSIGEEGKNYISQIHITGKNLFDINSIYGTWGEEQIISEHTSGEYKVTLRDGELNVPYPQGCRISGKGGTYCGLLPSMYLSPGTYTVSFECKPKVSDVDSSSVVLRTGVRKYNPTGKNQSGDSSETLSYECVESKILCRKESVTQENIDKHVYIKYYEGKNCGIAICSKYFEESNSEDGWYDWNEVYYSVRIEESGYYLLQLQGVGDPNYSGGKVTHCPSNILFRNIQVERGDMFTGYEAYDNDYCSITFKEPPLLEKLGSNADCVDFRNKIIVRYDMNGNESSEEIKFEISWYDKNNKEEIKFEKITDVPFLSKGNITISTLSDAQERQEISKSEEQRLYNNVLPSNIWCKYTKK